MPTLFGYDLETPLPIRGGRPGPGNRGRLRIERAAEDLLTATGELIAWDDDGGAQFALFSVARGILVWCSVSGAYLIDARVGLVQTTPSGNPEDWEHRISATIIPLLLAERGDLALHAATILDGRRAIAFCGTRGRGKSTLAAALALRGHVVASEDGTVISNVETTPLAWPGQIGVRITAQALHALGGAPSSKEPDEKARRLLPPSAFRPLPPTELAGIVVLRERGGNSLHLRHLDPASALPALIPNALYGGPGRLRATLSVAARIVERVPVFEARLPDDLGSVGDGACAIVETLNPGP